jgi:hypothetical protein
METSTVTKGMSQIVDNEDRSHSNSIVTILIEPTQGRLCGFLFRLAFARLPVRNANDDLSDAKRSSPSLVVFRSINLGMKCCGPMVLSKPLLKELAVGYCLGPRRLRQDRGGLDAAICGRCCCLCPRTRSTGLSSVFSPWYVARHFSESAGQSGSSRLVSRTTDNLLSLV